MKKVIIVALLFCIFTVAVASPYPDAQHTQPVRSYVKKNGKVVNHYYRAQKGTKQREYKARRSGKH